jgi:hypothetical protein
MARLEHVYDSLVAGPGSPRSGRIEFGGDPHGQEFAEVNEDDITAVRGLWAD